MQIPKTYQEDSASVSVWIALNILQTKPTPQIPSESCLTVCREQHTTELKFTMRLNS